MTDRRDNRPPDEGWALPARGFTYPEWYAARVVANDEPHLIRGEN